MLHANPYAVTLDELLAEPVVLLMMKADRVGEAEIRELFGGTLAQQRQVPSSKTAAIPARADDDRYRRGVGIILLNTENEVFVGRRLNAGADAWQMPQGGIEEAEDPRNAAFRELKEEIGTSNAVIIAESTGWFHYELPPELIGKVWNGRWRGQRQKWFVMHFKGQDDEINIGTEHPEFSAWAWVPARRAPELVVPFKRQVYLEVLAAFGMSLDSSARSEAVSLKEPV